MLGVKVDVLRFLILGVIGCVEGRTSVWISRELHCRFSRDLVSGQEIKKSLRCQSHSLAFASGGRESRLPTANAPSYTDTKLRFFIVSYTLRSRAPTYIARPASILMNKFSLELLLNPLYNKNHARKRHSFFGSHNPPPQQRRARS